MFYDVTVIQTYTKEVTVRVEAESKEEAEGKWHNGSLDKIIYEASNNMTEPYHYDHQDNDYDYLAMVEPSKVQFQYIKGGK